jgi:hypothetical protein
MAGPAAIVDNFDGRNGLIAAEGQSSGAWQVTSGSLSRDDGDGWTNSAVFRMVSLARDFGDVNVSVALQVEDLTARGPDYDGAHIWVRYQSESALYAVSVDRRDGTMIIKKKCAGGTDNGGTYYNLNAPVPGAPIPFGSWQNVTVSAHDRPDGSVVIIANRDGHAMEATDHGVGCAPLRGGGVGVRGDNAELRFARIVVQPLEGM